MSVAKKAVDSTIKRILVYTGEIIASIIILVIICLPLAFSVPMWIQRVVFDTAIEDLVVNPVAWFGYVGFVGAIIGLAVLSVIIGYPFVMKLIPGDTSKDVDEKEEDIEIAEDEEEPEIEEEEELKIDEGTESFEDEDAEEFEASNE